ncbi:MAG TPA: dihydrodipicolinate synthase family protein [Trueperaceae bacterium]|nr:dihydrodipicolinate synthase family protein [Trueperaceae bacterium]
MGIPKGGIIVPLVTPFDSENEVDLDGLGANVDSLITTGVTGLMCLATTGEAQSLNLRERKSVVEVTLAAADEKLPVIVGVGHTDVRETHELAEFATQLGAAGLFVITPYFYRYSAEQHARYFESLAQRVELPIMAYNSTYTGTPLTPDIVDRLVESSSIAAIKDGNQAQVGEIARRFGDQLGVFCARDVYLLETLASGGHGAVAFAANALPEALVAIVEAWIEGDVERARALQWAINPLVNHLVSFTFPSAVKAVTDLAGRVGGPTREPITPVGAEDRAALDATLAEVKRSLDGLERRVAST